MATGRNTGQIDFMDGPIYCLSWLCGVMQNCCLVLSICSTNTYRVPAMWLQWTARPPETQQMKFLLHLHGFHVVQLSHHFRESFLLLKPPELPFHHVCMLLKSTFVLNMLPQETSQASASLKDEGPVPWVTSPPYAPSLMLCVPVERGWCHPGRLSLLHSSQPVHLECCWFYLLNSPGSSTIPFVTTTRLVHVMESLVWANAVVS